MAGPPRRCFRSLALWAALAVSVFSNSAIAAADPEPAELVSRASGKSGAKANGPSYRPTISANGRFVVFESRATNLVRDDGDELIDVYVRDLKTNRTTLVSRASGPAGEKGNSDSTDASISADGRMVAFASTAGNLAPDATTVGASHVYVRDLVTDTTVRVDHASGAGAPIANDESGHPDISASGRYVAFDSPATNLDPADADFAADVYLRDLATQATSLVSHRSADMSGHDLALPAVSSAAERVAFRTHAVVGEGDEAELLPGRLFARDVRDSETATFGAGDEVLGSPSISADGQKVALVERGSASAPRGDRIRIWEPGSGRRITASRELAPWGRDEPGSSSDPSLSADGRYVAFAVQHGDRENGFRVGAVIRDLRRGRSTNVRGAVSRRSTKVPPFVPLFPTVSRGAGRLAYLTQARNPAAGDRDAMSDVYLVNRPRGPQ
jgi:Tol biopolymer transport system component